MSWGGSRLTKINKLKIPTSTIRETQATLTVVEGKDLSYGWPYSAGWHAQGCMEMPSQTDIPLEKPEIL